MPAEPYRISPGRALVTAAVLVVLNPKVLFICAAAGLAIGVPLGIVAGRLMWRHLADNFPLAYVPPLALLAVLLIVPAAIFLANLLAAIPARSAARIRPAEALRTE